MSTDEPAGSLTSVTLTSLKARVLAASAGTSVLFATAGVTGLPGLASTCTVLSLSVNVTVEPVVVRLQPSGTVTVQPPFLEWYGTNAVLSGMSPGGFDSTGTAGSEEIGASVGEA